MSSGSELIYDLKKRGGFWSYSEDILDTIPDTLLIEEALRRGEVKDIKLLFDLFSVKKIKQVQIINLSANKADFIIDNVDVTFFASGWSELKKRKSIKHHCNIKTNRGSFCQRNKKME